MGPVPAGLLEPAGPVPGEEAVAEEPPVGVESAPGSAAGPEEGPPPEDRSAGRPDSSGISDGDSDAPPDEGATDTRQILGWCLLHARSLGGQARYRQQGPWANGVAPMKLSTNTPVYAAHSAIAA